MDETISIWTKKLKQKIMKKISILIPCYNEEASLPLLYNELVKLMDSHTNYAWEILMVNDGIMKIH